MQKYYWLVSFFGDRDLGPLTLCEFYEACRELGWPYPKLFEEIDGTLRMRVYTEDFKTVYEGCPDFDYKTWLYRGANWKTVFEPVAARTKKKKGGKL